MVQVESFMEYLNTINIDHFPKWQKDYFLDPDWVKKQKKKNKDNKVEKEKRINIDMVE